MERHDQTQEQKSKGHEIGCRLNEQTTKQLNNQTTKQQNNKIWLEANTERSESNPGRSLGIITA